jgi:hypothetical protein
MEISGVKQQDPLWPTGVCLGNEEPEDGPDYWEIDLIGKYFKNDKLTISEDAYAKIREGAYQEELNNQTYPSWFRELSSKAYSAGDHAAIVDMMDAFTYAVRQSSQRFQDENLIPENESGNRIVRAYMVENDETLKEQFYNGLMEHTSAGKKILEQHRAEQEELSPCPRPTVDISDPQDFSLRLYQPLY